MLRQTLWAQCLISSSSYTLLEARSPGPSSTLWSQLRATALKAWKHLPSGTCTLWESGHVLFPLWLEAWEGPLGFWRVVQALLGWKDGKVLGRCLAAMCVFSLPMDPCALCTVCTNNMEPENYGKDMGREWVKNTNINLTCLFLT